MYGDHLEQAIVACAGEAECIAKIGAKVGAHEVLLVGISELGDVILTMQRIDVASHTVEARIADSLATGATPNDDQIGYYLAKLLPPGDFLRFGVIDIISSQAGALVTIGGEKRGKTPIQPLKLHAPASYDDPRREGRLHAVRDEDRAAARRRAPGRGEPVEARRGTAWYAHWYVLALGGVIVAGAAGGDDLLRDAPAAGDRPSRSAARTDSTAPVPRSMTSASSPSSW